MIICLSGFVIAGASPTSIPISARNDVMSCERLSVSGGLGGGLQLPGGVGGAPGIGGPGPTGVRYAAPHHALLQHFAPAATIRPGAARSSSSSAESVSPHSASPPPARPAPPLHSPHVSPHSSLTALAHPHHRHTRVRTLYACLGESDGELSFEPNQIITNVTASGEPGWLRGTLNGKTGLVPENYIEPLP